jgi:hypothetical protein
MLIPSIAKKKPAGDCALGLKCAQSIAPRPKKAPPTLAVIPRRAQRGPGIHSHQS